MDCVVRVATSADIPDIVDLYESASQEQLELKKSWLTHAGWKKPYEVSTRRLLESESQRGWVASIDGVTLGFCFARMEIPSGEETRPSGVISEIYVLPDARGIGLGELLLWSAVRWIRANGGIDANLTVLPGHRAAKNFCEQHGFTARALIMHREWGDQDPLEGLDESIRSKTADPGPRRAVAIQREIQREVAVGAAVVSDNRVILVKRNGEPYKGQWSLPGGRLAESETLEDAAKREVEEETGLDIRILGFLGVAEVDMVEPAKRYVICDFLAEPIGGDLRPGDDVSEVKWFGTDSLPDNLVPGVRDFAVHALEGLRLGLYIKTART